MRRVTAVLRVASSFKNVGMVPAGASQVMLVVKSLPASAGDIRAMGLIPGSGRSWHGNPLQYSCLLEGYSSEGCKESDMAEDLAHTHGTEQRPDAQHLPVDAVSFLTLSHWPHQG